MDLIALDVSGIVVDGSLLLAVPLAFLAGLVSFLSPCVLPLAPGYLAYVAGLTGSDLADEADAELSETQNHSLVVPDGSSSGATVSGVGDAPAAVVADGSSSRASESAAGVEPAPSADAAARAVDAEVARFGTSAVAGAEDSDVIMAETQKPEFIAGGGSSVGAAGGDIGASEAGAASASGATFATDSADAERSVSDGSSVGDGSASFSGVADGGSINGVQNRVPVDGVGRGRVLAGASLFVLGFSVVFVSYGAAFGGLGAWLLGHSRQISVVMGIVVIILGLGYLGLPALSSRMWWNADRRSHARPARGLWGAPLLGVLFGLGWTPCIGPTLAAVQTLAFTEASAVRGAVLSLAYCFGLGLPFIGMAVGLRAVAGATDWTRRHYLAISRFGGVMLMTIGVLLVTGWWNDIVAWLQGLVPGFTAVV